MRRTRTEGTAMNGEDTTNCFYCQGLGFERITGKSGQEFKANCFVCGGSGLAEGGSEDDFDVDTSEHDAPYDYPRRAA
jgi:hypothetical protein